MGEEIKRNYKYIFQETKSYNIQKTRSNVEFNTNIINSLKTFIEININYFNNFFIK